MDIVEINNTIEQLENGDATYSSCEKLASLYIVREHLTRNDVVKEYEDILPSYNAYYNNKCKYQLGEIEARGLETSMKNLCQEIYEFLHILYTSTDTQEEKNIIVNLLENIKGSY